MSDFDVSSQVLYKDISRLIEEVKQKVVESQMLV